MVSVVLLGVMPCNPWAWSWSISTEVFWKNKEIISFVKEYHQLKNEKSLMFSSPHSSTSVSFLKVSSDPHDMVTRDCLWCSDVWGPHQPSHHICGLTFKLSAQHLRVWPLSITPNLASKRLKRVHLVIKGFLCFERQDYSMLRNGAKLLVWMELHLKKTERKSNPISGRERPITWSPWPIRVMLKSGRQGAWEIWSYSHKSSCWFLSWMLCEG